MMIMLWKQMCDSDQKVSNAPSHHIPVDFTNISEKFYKGCRVEHDWKKEGYFFNTENKKTICLFRSEFRLVCDIEREEKIVKGFWKNTVEHLSNYHIIEKHFRENFTVSTFSQSYNNLDEVNISTTGHFLLYKSIWVLLTPDEYDNVLKYMKNKHRESDLEDLRNDLKVLTADEYKNFLKYKETLKTD